MDDISIRLQVFLARAGIGSRRQCEQFIDEGLVRVNGLVVKKPGIKVCADDVVEFRNARVKKSEKKIYVALNKPSKFLCSNADPDGRSLAIDLLKPVFKERLFYAGRLDYMTSGLIIYTNDGEFCKQITHPSNKIEKEYEVITKQEIPEELLMKFKKGIYVQGELFRCKRYEKRGPRMVSLILCEGKNREIRKVFMSDNIAVKKVHRVRIGTVNMKGILPGHFRKLTPKEIKALQSGINPERNIVKINKSFENRKKRTKNDGRS